MIKFNGSRSFNSNDYKFSRDQSGRMHADPNTGGVRIRTIYIINALAKGEKSVGELAECLQELHLSYTRADVYQPLKQLKKAGLLRVTGKNRSVKYSLATNAKTRWKIATKK